MKNKFKKLLCFLFNHKKEYKHRPSKPEDFKKGF